MARLTDGNYSMMTGIAAASLDGDPDLLKLTGYGTALGLANEGAAHNDGLMTLDEVG